jgi:3',5'-cyclic AMP phosphodiesterase CpdA
MPITLPPISRRRFLATSLATGAGLLLRPAFLAAAEADPHRLALLSDVHIDADPAAIDRQVVMYDHLKETIAQVGRLEPKPLAAFINGDCAHLLGRPEDYEMLVELLKPLREQGLPIHLSMGNHDNRDNLWKTIPKAESHEGPLKDRQVAIIELARANVFLLDSLQKTNVTPGVLGEAQVDWLGAALDAHITKPAIVMVHHQPDDRPKPDGLTDTKALLDVLSPRKHVKALFFGHTHKWEITSRSGIHCVNLPAVAYPFQKDQPTGWVDAYLREDGINLELHCIDPMHPKHGQRVDLTWRA